MAEQRVTIDRVRDLLQRAFERPYGSAERDELETLLGSPGIERLAPELAHGLGRMAVLIEVSRVASSSHALDDLLPRLMDLVTDTLDADRATLFLYDAEDGTLFSRLMLGDSVNEIRIPATAGIAGHVFGAGEPANIADAYADDRFNPEVDRSTGYRTRNILCAPLTNRDGRVIGVTQVLNKAEGVFSEADLALLGAMTTQAAAALELAHLFERVERQREEEAILLEVNSAVSSDLDIETLLSKVMEATTRLLDAERSTLFVYDGETDELWSRVAEGLGSKEIRFPAGAGIAGEAFRAKAVLNIPDAYADARFNPEIDRQTGFTTRSILCLPIRDKLGEPMAVMQVLNKRGGPFESHDERRLQAFSAQIAIALENARLFRDVLSLKNYNEGILRSLSSGVVTLDKDMVLSKANAAALGIIGLEAEEILGRTAEAVFGEWNDWVVRSLRFVAETGGNDYHADADLKLGQAGLRSVNLTVAPLFDIDDSAMGYMLVFDDITQDKRLRSTMARYLAKEVVDKVLESGDDPFHATAQEATILFSDIRQFTAIAESIGAGETVQMLNDYFSDMVEVVLRHGGLLDKYIGDAIMAVFGAPIVGPQDADDGVTVAIEMIRQLRRFNERREARGMEAIAIGVGVATGEVVAGSIGSEKRLDYTVIGDSVNLAARLESANKFFGTSVLIAGTTVAHMRAERPMRELDLLRVKGKSRPVAIFEPLEIHLEVPQQELLRLLPTFQRGIARYRQRDWRTAMAAFAEVLDHLPDDAPSKLYLNRCQYYDGAPPPDDWDGVWSMNEK
mgnify:CR=1 FL=1